MSLAPSPQPNPPPAELVRIVQALARKVADEDYRRAQAEAESRSR